MRDSNETLWKIGADISGRSNFSFFETPDEKYMIYFSNIDEYGMMKFVSPIQIWSDRKNPTKLFDSGNIHFDFQFSRSCYYLSKSDIIVLLIPCWRKVHYDLLYVLFDLNAKLFTSINSPNYELIESERGKIELDFKCRYAYDQEILDKISKFHGEKFELKDLKWVSLKKLKRVCDLKPRLKYL